MKRVCLFLSIIATALLMTSCLKEEDNSYVDSTFVYIDKDDADAVYGKAFSRNPYTPSIRLITNKEIEKMDFNTFKVMGFQWEEGYGVKQLTIDGYTLQADVVSRFGEVMDVKQTLLNMTQLPEEGPEEGQEEEQVNSFLEILRPIYSNDKSTMNDYWIFELAYRAKEDDEARIDFYKRDKKNDNDEIVIDIRLTLSGKSEEEAAKKAETTQNVKDAVAVDMSPLRELSSTSDELKIRFKYYIDGKEQESQNSYLMRLKPE